MKFVGFSVYLVYRVFAIYNLKTDKDKKKKPCYEIECSLQNSKS